MKLKAATRNKLLAIVAIAIIIIYLFYQLSGQAHYIQMGKCENCLLWYPEQASVNRILEQINYIPPEYNSTSLEKVILILSDNNELGTNRINLGTKNFENCKVNKCNIITSANTTSSINAVIYKLMYYEANITKTENQVRIFFSQESPVHVKLFEKSDIINWTITYREDSDLVAPYGKWIYYNNHVKSKLQNINYAANKTKSVAWFVSNCQSKNNRLDYARELSKYIQVDIYGSCGSLKCPRSEQSKCFDLLSKEYKFYLAFENSNCEDYITEKFFKNSLQYNILPIVMGAPIDNYNKVAPLHSFIHVEEFSSPKELADFLHLLDQNDELYNSYFQWKGTGTLMDTKFWCRLCSMLHSPYPKKEYTDINKWLRKPGTCSEEIF